MKFELRAPFVIFHDDKPGSHATLFAANGHKLRFRGDVSSFSDARLTYTWAFEGAVKRGDRVVFATADREVIGRILDGEVRIESTPRAVVERDASGKPHSVSGAVFPPVEVLLESPRVETSSLPSPSQPHRSRPRPIPMLRPR